MFSLEDEAYAGSHLVIFEIDGIVAGGKRYAFQPQDDTQFGGYARGAMVGVLIPAFVIVRLP